MSAAYDRPEPAESPVTRRPAERPRNPPQHSGRHERLPGDWRTDTVQFVVVPRQARPPEPQSEVVAVVSHRPVRLPPALRERSFDDGDGPPTQQIPALALIAPPSWTGRPEELTGGGRHRLEP